MSDEQLSAAEARVLGCLIEKEATTPDNYPLTLNSLRLACNQSSSRDPVVSYDDATVSAALQSLRERQLIRIVYSPSNRATKYRHVVDETLGLDRAPAALLCLLLLRGPQTAGELRTRADRLAPFPALEAVEDTLDGLAGREPPLVARLERQPGQKESRYAQLLAVDAAGTSPPSVPATSEPPVPATSEPPVGSAPLPSQAGPAGGGGEPDGLAGRVGQLEAEVEELRAEVEELRAEVDRLRRVLAELGGLE